MKKLYAIFFVAIALYATDAFAEKQYIKYRLADKEILAMGAMPDMRAGAGEEVSVIDSKLPSEPISNFVFDTKKKELVRKSQSSIDKISAEQNFNVTKLTSRLSEVFTGGDAIDLAPYLRALERYTEVKKIKEIYQFGLGLVAKEKATQEQVEVIFGLYLEQGINLSEYAE
jgi:hypothetical protein